MDLRITAGSVDVFPTTLFLTKEGLLLKEILGLPFNENLELSKIVI